MLRNYNRNKMLVDLSEVPTSIRINITKQFETTAVGDRKRLLTYLESILKNIDFAASQMDRMLREHQALSRINQTMNSEGMSNLYTKEKSQIADLLIISEKGDTTTHQFKISNLPDPKLFLNEIESV